MCSCQDPPLGGRIFLRSPRLRFPQLEKPIMRSLTWVPLFAGIYFAQASLAAEDSPAKATPPAPAEKSDRVVVPAPAVNSPANPGSPSISEKQGASAKPA